MKPIELLRKLIKGARNIWVIRLYLLILLSAVVLYFYNNDDIGILLRRISIFRLFPLLLLLNLFFFLSYTVINYLTYRALKTNISFWQTFLVVAFSRLGVYVPGKVWYAANYYMFSRSFNIEPEKIGKSFVINNAMLFFTGALCSLFAISQLPFVARYFLIVLPLMMLVLVHPKVLNKIFSILTGKLGQVSHTSSHNSSKDEVSVSSNYSLYLKIIILYFINWYTIGITLYLCIRSFEPIDLSTLPIITAAGAAGLIIGLVAVFAPGGLGIREGIGIAVLAQLVSVETAVLSCLLMRLVQVIFDFTVGGMAAGIFMKKKPNDIIKYSNVNISY